MWVSHWIVESRKTFLNSLNLQHLKLFMHLSSTASLKVKRSAAAEMLHPCFLQRSEYVTEKWVFLSCFHTNDFWKKKMKGLLWELYSLCLFVFLMQLVFSDLKSAHRSQNKWIPVIYKNCLALCQTPLMFLWYFLCEATNRNTLLQKNVPLRDNRVYSTLLYSTLLSTLHVWLLEAFLALHHQIKDSNICLDRRNQKRDYYLVATPMLQKNNWNPSIQNHLIKNDLWTITEMIEIKGSFLFMS